MLPRNRWPMARVTEVYKDDTDGLVRSVKLRFANSKGELIRPIQKLVVILPADLC